MNYLNLRQIDHSWFVNRQLKIAILLLFVGVASTFLFWQQMPIQAQTDLNCSTAYVIDETLPNGGRWQMCWEHRALDGIVLHDIHYTPPNGIQRRVLSQASISQIHVPYDDNSARFHDVTDYGLGGPFLNDLTAADCPNGTLLRYSGKDVLCQQIQHRGHAYKGVGQHQQGYMFTLFSVSTSGEYNYIPQWHFFDDGTLEPTMGATGRLQRFGTDRRYGWPVRANGTTGVSHIHNYYWRLDFDLDENSDNDIVEEIELVPTQDGRGRQLSVSRLTHESSRSTEPGHMRSWRIRDGSVTNANGFPISYHLKPLRTGHRDEGPSYEPWTHDDFYVTTYKSCERYVSHNPEVGGCGSSISDFVNGESLVDADLVLWYGVTFHHIPRDEDEPYMHAHWDGFQIVPRDWTAQNPLVTNLSPMANFTADPSSGTVPLTVNFDASASTDADGNIVEYRWELGNSTTGFGQALSHTYPTTGTYTITLTVTDDDGATATATETITVIRANTPPVLINPGDQRNAEGENISLFIEASDADGDLLTFGATDLPAGLTIHAPTGQISGTLALNSTGQYSVTVEVNDGQVSSQMQFNWTVHPCGQGDVNCDRSVDGGDALFILQHNVGLRGASHLYPLPEGTLFIEACDVSGDGLCDAVDALQVLQCGVGLGNSLCP